MVQHFPLSSTDRRDRLRPANGVGCNFFDGKARKALRSSNTRMMLVILCIGFMFATLLSRSPENELRSEEAQRVGGAETLSTEEIIGTTHVVKRYLESEVQLLVKLSVPPESTATNKTINLTGNQIEMTVNPRKCKNPGLWVRLVGDALVAVNLVEDKSKHFWSAAFDLPTAGSYFVDVRWYGCGEKHAHYTTPEPIPLYAVGLDPLQRIEATSLFPNSWWYRSIGGSIDGRSLPQYMWKNLEKGAPSDDLIPVQSMLVSKSGSTKESTGFYDFDKLSNYELVCFWGSKTMSDIRDSFLEIKGTVSPYQRPFKFHYYNISTFEQPDRDWIDDAKTRVRKCKHILVALDEDAEPVSQAVYKQQVTTFVGHLLKLLDDDSFPIWFFTVNEPPMHATNCHSPFLSRTSGHPCNDVLKSLFSSNSFPEQVHLLDNTGLSLPQFDESRENVLANIAMRILVLVGWTVADWRSKGQSGAGDGLHRNDTVVPNFELVPYPWP